ncbi:MAG: ACP S-malonyltransferase, partial [Gammaproteobacteria bacterium]
MEKFAFVFPGQGSQKLGMLSALAAANPVIVNTFNEASAVLDMDLWQICQQDSGKSLNQTEITPPVLLAASVAIWRCWQEQAAARPSMVAGHSLGEYSALSCAGVLEFSDAVAMVHQRGRL